MSQGGAWKSAHMYGWACYADTVFGIEGASALSQKVNTIQLGVGEHRSVSGMADARPSGNCLLQDIARYTCAQLLQGLLSKFIVRDSAPVFLLPASMLKCSGQRGKQSGDGTGLP